MMVWHIIALTVALLLFLILFCPFRIRLVYLEEVTLKMGYLFAVFRVLPKKPKPASKKPAPKKSDKKQESSALRKKKKKNPVLEFTKKQGLEGIIELLKEIVGIVMKLADAIRRHLVISKLRLDLMVVGDDPADTAMKYGYACSAIYPLLSLLDRHTKLRRHEEYIDAGFQAEKTQVRLILDVHIIPIFVIVAAAEALIGSIRIFRKIKQ